MLLPKAFYSFEVQWKSMVQRGGVDTLNFSAFSGSLKATQSNGALSVEDVTFKDFEIIKDSNSDGPIGEETGAGWQQGGGHPSVVWRGG